MRSIVYDQNKHTYIIINNKVQVQINDTDTFLCDHRALSCFFKFGTFDYSVSI